MGRPGKMDFSRKIRVREDKRSQEFDDLAALYPHSCMMYLLPPKQDITLDQFEEIAIERLKVFRILEQAGMKNLRYQSDEWKEAIIEEMNVQKLKLYVRLIQHGGTATSEAKRETDLLARQRDYISHFILRLVYAKSEEMKRYGLVKNFLFFFSLNMIFFVDGLLVVKWNCFG